MASVMHSSTGCANAVRVNSQKLSNDGRVVQASTTRMTMTTNTHILENGKRREKYTTPPRMARAISTRPSAGHASMLVEKGSFMGFTANSRAM